MQKARNPSLYASVESSTETEREGPPVLCHGSCPLKHRAPQGEIHALGLSKEPENLTWPTGLGLCWGSPILEVASRLGEDSHLHPSYTLAPFIHFVLILMFFQY